MISIAACSVYIPRCRLPRETLAEAWGGRPASGAKAVANFDEDALTMGHSAVARLAVPAPDRFYFASTTAPYWQRSSSSQIAAAADWGPETATADFGGSLRSGFSALLAGFDAIASGDARKVIVTAADRRDAPPESAEEAAFGDGSAGICVTASNGPAEVVAFSSRSDDFLDEWRRDADSFVHSYTSKYSLTRGFESNIVSVAQTVLGKAGVKSSELAAVAVNSPDGRAHPMLAKGLGVEPARIHTDASAGVTGAAMPLIALASALASASPGDLILALAYGDGADAVLLRCNAPVPLSGRTDTAPPIPFPSYARYRKSREYLRQDSSGPEISNVLWKKEERQNVRLHGTRCPECGVVQFPITRVCAACRNSQGLLEIALGRCGRVFTFTKDFLYDAPVQPTVMTVVDLEGGGRFLCQMTDVNERDVHIGMPVELVLRRLREGGHNHHYYWKCRPV